MGIRERKGLRMHARFGMAVPHLPGERNRKRSCIWVHSNAFNFIPAEVEVLSGCLGGEAF